LLVQYYKRLKNKFKDEILWKDKSDISKELIELVYSIDNQFYIWDFKKKENYNLSNKYINNWYKYNKKTGNRNSDVMEINVIRSGKIFEQTKTKYMENKICFNCGKTGYMVQSCWNGKGRQRGSDGRM